MKTTSPSELTARETKDLRILALFTSVYCRRHHAEAKVSLPAAGATLAGMAADRPLCCAACREFLEYAFERRLRCRLEPKPLCKHCPVHCYRPGHRERVREIMRFSGRFLILRGRLDLLWHYFF